MRKLLSCGVLLMTVAAGAANIHFTYPDWKYKALTFSYDDGVVEDRKLVEILNRYGMKATFNVSAGRAGRKGFLPLAEYAELYRGHEISSHGFQHLNMRDLTDEALEREIREDLVRLEKVAGYPVRGFAYPYGAYDERVKRMLAKYGITYARTTESVGTTRLVPAYDPLEFNPQAHHNADLLALGEKYRNYRGWGGVLTMCAIWGHSYEFERQGNWDLIETFCREMANRPDIWYATNGEIFDYLDACRQVRATLDGSVLFNPTATTIYLYVDGKKVTLPPNQVEVVPVAPAADLPAGSYPLFPGGRRKALSFSYDDGNDPVSDARLIGILNAHGMKGTFNVNGKRNIDYSIYSGHEVATHGFTHALYRTVPFDWIVSDIYRDRDTIEKAVKYPVRGHAYPSGSAAISPQSISVLKGCGIVYARATEVREVGDFSIPATADEWLNWKQTAHHSTADIMAIGKAFKERKDAPLLCAIWGHSWEFARQNNWELIEQFADFMANDPDIWYATNIEIYDYCQAVKNLQWSADSSFVRNMSATPVYYWRDGKVWVIPAGETVRF